MVGPECEKSKAKIALPNLARDLRDKAKPGKVESGMGAAKSSWHRPVADAVRLDRAKFLEGVGGSRWPESGSSSDALAWAEDLREGEAPEAM